MRILERLFPPPRRCFYRAIDLDPSYALAYASAAFCFWARKSNGWMIDFPSKIKEAERLARRAAELAKGDAHAHGLSGFVLAGVVGDLDDGAALIERAQLLNPNLARAWQFSAWVQIWLGEPERAIEHATGGKIEWSALLRELDRLSQARMRCGEKDWLIRTEPHPR